MARPAWSGSISFGLVNVPVKLFTAKRDQSVRFNQLDQSNGARVRQKRVNEVTGEEVETADIVKGYEVSKGSYVIVTEDDLAAVSVDATHRLDLECFVDLSEVDPIFYDGAYLVAPAGPPKPYALLVRAMEEAGKVGIARFVMRSKEHIAVLRPLDGKLVMSMMAYADELVGADTIPEFDDLATVEVSEKELAMASSLIDALSEPFEPTQYHDSYREQMMAMIEAKAAGISPSDQLVAAAPSSNVVDLLEALQASVEASKASRTRHPTARPVDAKAKPAKSPSKSTARKKPAAKRKSA